MNAFAHLIRVAFAAEPVSLRGRRPDGFVARASGDGLGFIDCEYGLGCGQSCASGGFKALTGRCSQAILSGCVHTCTHTHARTHTRLCVYV